MEKEKDTIAVKRKFEVPHTYVILFFVVMTIAVCTWIIPPGQFQYEKVEVNGVMRTLAISGSYQRLSMNEAHPAGVLDFFSSFHKGMIQSADLIMLIFIVSGAFYIIVKTGAFHAMIGSLLKKFDRKDKIIIPICFTIFALGGSLFGMLNEFNGFYPIFVGLGVALGYDGLLGMAIMTLGMYIGFASSIMTPFTVVIAQSIAGLPIYSASWYRVICLIVFSSISIWWIFRYGRKIKADPKQSLMFGEETKYSFNQETLVQYPMTSKCKVILGVVVLFMVCIMYGFIKLGWGPVQLTGMFLFMSMIVSMIDGWSANKYANTFLEGCGQVLFGALIVGIAKAIIVLMQDAMIIDTIIYTLGNALQNVPSFFAAQGMLVVQTLLNFLIPSGSGQAATIMPIMTPIADMLGVSRQVAVLAYQFGDGFSNLLWPTCGVTVSCGLAGIPLNKWWKFFIPLFGILFAAQMIMLSIAIALGL